MSIHAAIGLEKASEEGSRSSYLLCVTLVCALGVGKILLQLRDQFFVFHRLKEEREMLQDLCRRRRFGTKARKLIPLFHFENKMFLLDECTSNIFQVVTTDDSSR